MPSPNNKKINDPSLPYFDITFHVLKSDKEKYESCIEQMESYEKQDKLIPVKLLREWTQYIHPKERIQQDADLHTQNANQKISEDVIKYFGQQADYNISRVSSEKVEFHFDEFVYSIISLYSINVWSAENYKKNIRNIDNKKGTLNYFYNSICINSEYFDKPGNPLFTFYQKVVMAAYITQQLGYKFWVKQAISNKEIYDSAKKSILRTQK